MTFRREYRFAAAIGTALLAVAGAAAQSHKEADSADQSELYRYVLSTDRLEKLGRATKALGELAKKHPDYNGISDSKTLNEMDRRMSALPEVVSALAACGLKPREYAAGIMTVVQATMAVGFKKAGTYKDYPPDMLKLVSRANLAFVEQHWEEIQKLTKDSSGDQ